MDVKAKVDELVNMLKADPKLLEQFKADPVKALEGLTGIDLSRSSPWWTASRPSSPWAAPRTPWANWVICLGNKRSITTKVLPGPKPGEIFCIQYPCIVLAYQSAP